MDTSSPPEASISEDFPSECRWPSHDYTDATSSHSEKTLVQGRDDSCIIRLSPHPDHPDALHFHPIVRRLGMGQEPLRVGRYSSKYGDSTISAGDEDARIVTFTSMVVSRSHSVIWMDSEGKVLVKDEKSISGTFVQGERVSSDPSGPPTELRNGDTLQLGTTYKFGVEAWHRHVEAIVEIERLDELKQSLYGDSESADTYHNKSSLSAITVLEDSPVRDGILPGLGVLVEPGFVRHSTMEPKASSRMTAMLEYLRKLRTRLSGWQLHVKRLVHAATHPVLFSNCVQLRPRVHPGPHVVINSE